MTSRSGEISVDATGAKALFVRGPWTSDVDRMIGHESWDILAIHGVEWKNYECLLPHASKIKRLRVPFGPDDSTGLDGLIRLFELRSTDVLRPAIDFRKFPELHVLEAIWDGKRPEFFSSPSVESLTLHSASGTDLKWIPLSSNLKRIELTRGRLSSLRGIEHATRLEELRVLEQGNVVDAESVAELKYLRVLELDAPKATFSDLDWVSSQSRLERLLISSQVERIDWLALGKHESLHSIGLTATASSNESDAEIRAALSASGKSLVEFKRFKGKVPAFAATLV